MPSANPANNPHRPSALRARIVRLATAPRLPLWCGLAALLVMMPSLWAGWLADDYLHRLMLLGSRHLTDLPASLFGLFNFMDGDPARTHRLMDAGIIPWWTLPEARVAFWRPVTGFSHWIDYRWWPDSALLMHAHSLLYLGLLAAAVTILYRRIMGWGLAAGLAALFYALDDARVIPAGFLANRNALLATLFGTLALITHDWWRRAGWRHGSAVGPALLLLSLWSGEMGAATVGYLVAYALCMDPARPRQAWAALIPYAIILIGWRILWSGLGYGVYGIGLYIDPAHEPLRFAAALLDRIPFLLIGQFAFPPADLYGMLYGPGRAVYAGVAILLIVGAAAVILPALRRDPAGRFWAVGTALALLPAATTWPSDRLLSLVGVGGSAIVGQFVAAAWTGTGISITRTWQRRITRPLCGLFIFIHGIAAPLHALSRARWPMGPGMEHMYVQTPLDARIAEQDVIIVNAPLAILTGYLPVRAELDGQPIPRRTRSLGPSLAHMDVQRTDEHTLTIRPDQGFLRWVLDDLFRNRNHPLRAGDRIELTGMTVEITATTPDGRPAEAAFKFDTPLEDPGLRWIQWTGSGYAPFVPPAVGETVRLSSMPKGLLY